MQCQYSKCTTTLTGRQRMYCSDRHRKAHDREKAKKKPDSSNGRQARPRNSQYAPEDFAHLKSGMVVRFIDPSMRDVSRNYWCIGVVNRLVDTANGLAVEIVTSISIIRGSTGIEAVANAYKPEDVYPFEGLAWHKEHPEKYPAGELAYWGGRS